MKKENKINAKELRIGNYVYTKEWVIKSYGIDGFVNIIKNIDNFKPIPLTEEWLIKLNFKYKKTEKSNSYSLDFFRVSFVIDGRYKGKMFISVANLNPDVNNFLYVHQLQNLYFALTGKEL